MSTERTERIRQRAYELWETQGRPEGRELEHWETARLEFESDEAQADETDSQNPGAGPQGDDLSAEFTAPEPDQQQSLRQPDNGVGGASIGTRSNRGKKNPRQ